MRTEDLAIAWDEVKLSPRTGRSDEKDAASGCVAGILVTGVPVSSAWSVMSRNKT
jgi:hypothetical protein